MSHQDSRHKVCISRRRIRVSKILVHEDFTDSAIDIALLKLGKIMSGDPLFIQFAEERADLSVFSPVCLPDIGESFLGQNGIVYGEQRQTIKVFLPFSKSLL